MNHQYFFKLLGNEYSGYLRVIVELALDLALCVAILCLICFMFF